MTSATDHGTEAVEQIDRSRRSLFALAALPLLALGLGSRARAAAAPACFNPAALSADQTGMRKGLNFRQSTDAQKRCGVCMFFTGSTAGCGRCQLLLNGPVSAGTVCDAWAKKS